MFVLGFPLLLIPFAIYNIVAFIFLLPGDIWTARAFTLHMMSGQDWALSWSDMFLAVSLFLLWVEIFKTARIGMRSVMDHILAITLFVAILVEFVLVQRAETSTFFLLMAIALIDVLAGFVVGMRRSHRPIELEGPGQI
jgi:hypothetical protein